MKARELIEGAAYDPDDLKTISHAFEAAWKRIAPDVGKRPDAIAAARLKLANVVLSVASNGITSSEALTEAALKLMFADPTEL